MKSCVVYPVSAARKSNTSSRKSHPPFPLLASLLTPRLGLTPIEEIDYAYIAYNIGLDVFYPSNNMYIARQVVTK